MFTLFHGNNIKLLLLMSPCSGYMAPEYAMHGQFSVKSDVFSFGVLVLEIVSGQRNNCIRNGENVEDLLSYVCINSFLFLVSVSLVHKHKISKIKIAVKF